MTMAADNQGPSRRDVSRKALVDGIEALYCARQDGRLDDYVAFFAPDARLVVVGNPALSPGAGMWIGHEGIRRFLQTLHDQNDYLSHSISDIVSEGEHVMVRWQAEIRFLDTGRTGTFEALDHICIDDGLIVEMTHFHDTGGVAIARGRIKIA